MTAKIADIADKKFDYIIAGGGTSGLALACRLAEDSSITVAVLEAGESLLDDPKVYIPAQWKLTSTFGDPKYDWCFPYVEQKYDKPVRSWSRGKGLGGTSCMNFYVWSKPPVSDINNIEKLGNPGWNWDEYLKYSKLSETFHPASPEHAAVYPHSYEPKYRGNSGPIQVIVPHHVHTFDHVFQDTMVKKGLKSINDPYGGDISGTWMANNTMDPKLWTRSYAGSAYFLPNRHRKNLMVLTGATVARVLFADNRTSDNLNASGVEFVHDDVKHIVYVNKEVIISAGTIKSPQILELSGIGRPEILSSIGVPVKVALPGVGENVQEHVAMSISLEVTSEHQTADILRDPVHAAEAIKLHAEGKGLARMGLTSFAFFPLSTANPMDAPAIIERAVKRVEERKKDVCIPPGLAEQLDLQLATLCDGSLPDLEILAIPAFFGISKPEPGKNYITLGIVVNHPFSRGTIHASSNDPMMHPEIDPRYLEEDIDLELLVQHLKFIRSLNEIEPWKSAIVREVQPGPACETDEHIYEYVKNSHNTIWHTASSCSMLPREKQGVVDPNLKVYGTNNVRVVDISIIPLHVAAHPQATAYMIAEKASDIIRGIRRI